MKHMRLEIKEVKTPILTEYLLLLLLGLMQGMSFVFMKVGVESITPISLVFLRLLFSALIIIPYLFFDKTKYIIFAKKYKADFFLLSISSIIAPFALITWVESRISSGVVSVYMAMISIFVAILGEHFGVEKKLGPISYIGLSLGFIGICMLSYQNILGSGISVIWPHLACLLSAICYALSIVKTRMLPDIPAKVISINVIIFALITIIPMFLLDYTWKLQPSPESLISVFFLSLISTVGALALLYLLIDRVGGLFTSMANYIVPLAGLFWGATILDEKPSLLTIPSVIVIILGLWLVRKKR
jgi:drug/metabolite transporter (DMT)-like permease